MPKEIISTKQAIYMLTLYIFSSNILIGFGTQVRQDGWIATIITLGFAVPTLVVYARILRLNPEKNLPQIVEDIFGKWLGKLIIALMTWYALHLGSLVMSNFYYFVGVSVLMNTPHLYIVLLMALVCIYMAKSGIEVLGKWSVVVFLIPLFVVLISLGLSFDLYRFEYLLPMFDHSLGDLARSAYAGFAFPFAEMVVFLFFGHSLQKQASPYKIYLSSCMIGWVLIMIVEFRNLTVLGPAMEQAVYFPSYTSARVIKVSTFLTRVEGTISMNYFLSGIVKISLCLIAASIGFTYLFGIQDYKKVIVPTGMLMVGLCMINFKNIMEMYNFASIYQFYAIPFQIIIPIALWIGSEIRSRKRKKQQITKECPE